MLGQGFTYERNKIKMRLPRPFTSKNVMLYSFLLLTLTGCQNQTGLTSFSEPLSAPLGKNTPASTPVRIHSASEAGKSDVQALKGTVVDIQDHKPVAHAVVFHDGTMLHPNSDGSFELKKISIKFNLRLSNK